MVSTEIKDVHGDGTRGGSRRHGDGTIWAHDEGSCWNSPAATTRDQVRRGGYGHCTIAILDVGICGLSSPTNRMCRHGLDWNDGDILRLTVHRCCTTRNLLMRQQDMIRWHRTMLLLLRCLIFEAVGSCCGRIDVINRVLLLMLMMTMLLSCVHLEDVALNHIHVCWILRSIVCRMIRLW